MANFNSESFKMFEALVAQTNNTYAFNDESSVKGVGVLLDVIKSMGLNPLKTKDLKEGLFSLFNIEIINMPDFDNNRFILAPNHVSDLDALILGLLHPNIRVVAKIDWTSNEKLRQFLDIHYDLHGLDRASLQSLRSLVADSIKYFAKTDENKHFLVFNQGTISDFNNNSPERVSTIAQKISCRADVPVVSVFIEQVSLNHPTRIIFDEPIELSPKDDFRKIWLEREAAMQKSLVPPARLPKLTHKHANNNKPGDIFF